jgi:hypothetical protein
VAQDGLYISLKLRKRTCTSYKKNLSETCQFATDMFHYDFFVTCARVCVLLILVTSHGRCGQHKMYISLLRGIQGK